MERDTSNSPEYTSDDDKRLTECRVDIISNLLNRVEKGREQEMANAVSAVLELMGDKLGYAHAKILKASNFKDIESFVALVRDTLEIQNSK